MDNITVDNMIENMIGGYNEDDNNINVNINVNDPIDSSLQLYVPLFQQEALDDANNGINIKQNTLMLMSANWLTRELRIDAEKFTQRKLILNLLRKKGKSVLQGCKQLKSSRRGLAHLK